MYEILSKELYIDSDVCNCNGVLRSSSMLLLFQKISGEHSSLIKLGKAETFDRGRLWVLARESVEVERLPRYGETVTLRTWVNKTRLGLFPRNYDITDGEGRTIVRAASIWGLMDISTRSFARVDDIDISAYETKTGTEISAKKKLPRDAFEGESEEVFEHEFDVPFSYLDVNRHMNNTRYLDLADDLLPSPADGKELKALSIELAQEIRPGMPVNIKWRKLEDGSWYMEGQTDKPCYRLMLRY